MGITVEDYMRAVQRGVRAGMSKILMLEPQTGPWVNQNLWGDQHTQPLPAAPGAIVQVLPKNSGMYGPPAVHSVQLARGDETPAANSDVRARVAYGCGGARNSFDCDWLHGAQFSLVCNELSVNAISYAPDTGTPYDPSGGNVFLAASVAKGSVNSNGAPLTYTEPSVTLADAGPTSIAEFPVRDFVREFTVHLSQNNDATLKNITVSFIGGGSTSYANYDISVFAGGRRVPIPGMTVLVRIRNLAVGNKTVTPQWFLGL